ncbi:ABC transporter ATP-binding protein [Desulfovibrio sp.]
MTAPAIAASDLRKRFGDVQAVDGVTFSVDRGEIFGFLGPNGAGKSTTINMLNGLARPDSGGISVGGVDCVKSPRAAQGLIGVVPDESNLYPELTGFENLCFCAALYGLGKTERRARAEELLNAFGLAEAERRKFGGYSKGMKRKLVIAAGVIHRPPILFLDEPTTGIDLASVRQIRQLVAGLNRSGTTIFLTTHYIEEAERLCGRVAFIVSGRIIRIDSVENLLQPVRSRHVLRIAANVPLDNVAGELAGSFPGFDFQAEGANLLRIEADAPVPVGPLVRFLEDRGVEVAEARRMRPSLEDVFAEVTGMGADVLRQEKGKSGGRA